MTRDEMQELRRLAEHATDDAWDWRDEDVNSAFFRAAQPDSVLSLIARIEELEATAERQTHQR